jgi:cyclophilin family peptidyl-prolyl cis-trans isomerase
MRKTMDMKVLTVSGVMALAMATQPVLAQTAAPAAAAPVVSAPDSAWRTVAPENLLVIDTNKGRILVELEPRMAPQAVERIRTLADRGFYDGLKFHRVMAGFMAQTGDPEGTGAGGSDLPDLPGEFQFRRGADSHFVAIPESGAGLRGFIGSSPIETQPDAQMMFNADGKVTATGMFCPGVVGMARNNDPNSANSQFFLTLGESANLNGAYTPFGKILLGQEVVAALKVGPESDNGTVTDPDFMTRVRSSSALPETERLSVRVMLASDPAYAAVIETRRASRGARFSICDAAPPAELIGG